MSILVTGGAGYIGSHTCIELLSSGFDIVIVDNLCNSSRLSIHRIEEITGKKIKFYHIDLLDKPSLHKVFELEQIDSVIHFAGLKAVGESVAKPLDYYINNINGTLTLCDTMQEFGVKELIFSSSATVYGNPATVPIKEDFPVSPTNPYGRTKLMIETILNDLFLSDPSWHITILRYFNPIGAHSSGLIGEDPKGIPNNLVPYITQVAVGKLELLNVFGNDYDTPDGSGIRDYIHVADLAAGHVKALEHIHDAPGIHIYNLGTGQGYSVYDLIQVFSNICGKQIPYRNQPRRPGDIAICYADASLAEKELEWTASRSLNEMCADAWNWQLKNPYGFQN